MKNLEIAQAKSDAVRKNLEAFLDSQESSIKKILDPRQFVNMELK